GDADRLSRHTPEAADVRVPRSPDQHRDSAYTRFSRAVAEVVRWPRKLQHGAQRAGRVPRDQHRLGRVRPGNERHVRYDRLLRRDVSRAPEPVRNAFQTVKKSIQEIAAKKRIALMAKKSWIAKSLRSPKFKTRAYNRCRLCGRSRATYRKFQLCRLCLRQLAHR